MKGERCWDKKKRINGRVALHIGAVRCSYIHFFLLVFFFFKKLKKKYLHCVHRNKKKEKRENISCLPAPSATSYLSFFVFSFFFIY